MAERNGAMRLSALSPKRLVEEHELSEVRRASRKLEPGFKDEDRRSEEEEDLGMV